VVLRKQFVQARVDDVEPRDGQMKKSMCGGSRLALLPAQKLPNSSNLVEVSAISISAKLYMQTKQWYSKGGGGGTCTMQQVTWCTAEKLAQTCTLCTVGLASMWLAEWY